VKSSYDITINFPWGCGGNFLAHALLKNPVSSHNANNTYQRLGSAYDFNNMDHKPLHAFVSSTGTLNDTKNKGELLDYLDRIYENAQHLLTKKDIAREIDILIGHYPPWFYNRIWDYETAEMVFVDLLPETKWIARAMTIYKNRMSNDYVQQPTMIKEIMEFVRRYPSDSAYDRVEFDITWQRLQNEIDVGWIKNTGVSWHYYAYIKHGNMTPSSENFRLFIDDLLFPRVYFADWFHTQYYDVQQWFMQQHPNCHSIEYTKLFFDRDLPTGSMLNQVDARSLNLYSRSNLQIIRKVMDLLPRYRQDFCNTQLQMLEQRLDKMRD
jgi:hypothetical protein